MIQEVAKINNGDRDKLIHICLIRGGKIKFVAKKDSWKEVSNLVYFLDLLIIKRL